MVKQLSAWNRIGNHPLAGSLPSWSSWYPWLGGCTWGIAPKYLVLVTSSVILWWRSSNYSRWKFFCKALPIENISIIIIFTIVTISVKASVSHTKFDWRHQDLTLYGHHGHHRRCESPAAVVSHSCDGTNFDWRHQDLSHRLGLSHPLYRHTVTIGILYRHTTHPLYRH